MVEIVALEVLEHFDINNPIGARDPSGSNEGADGFGSKSAAAHAGERRHARIVPTVDAALLHQLQKLALAHQRVSDAETVKLNLLRGEDAQLLDEPAI